MIVDAFCEIMTRMESNTTPNPGGFVISLDFELHWGVRDHRTVDQYRYNLLGVRQAVPAILKLFERYGIHATWATVGFLFFESFDSLKAGLPDELPRYREPKLDPYAALSDLGKNEEEDPFHFAPGLIKKILAHDGQEIGTHTFSHFYTQARGPTLESFRADLRSARSVARQYGISLKSIVFPRNQISRQHLRVCAEEGLIAYRGLPGARIEAGNGVLGRAARFAGSYLSLNGDDCFVAKIDEEGPIVDVPGSRFLRPWNAVLKRFETMRLKRIYDSMTTAAKSGKSYHLWWHPHNFGVHLEENMAVLTRIVEHFEMLNREIGWPSLSMAEVAENVLRTEKPHWVA